MIALTNKEYFRLGVAYGSFSVSEIDQGVHTVLPVRDVDTGERENDVFEELVNIDFLKIPRWIDDPGVHYMKAIASWAKRHNIDLEGETL